MNARPQFRVGQRGAAAPQMSMKEGVGRYGTQEADSDASPVSSGTATAAITTPDEPIEAEEPPLPAFLPPSEGVSGSAIVNDSKRIWEAAEFFHAHMYATKRRAPPATLINVPLLSTVLPPTLPAR